MPHTTDDLRILDIKPLATPLEVMAACPATPNAEATVTHARRAAHEILQGRDDRLIVPPAPDGSLPWARGGDEPAQPHDAGEPAGRAMQRRKR